jgi:hypothetical protein
MGTGYRVMKRTSRTSDVRRRDPPPAARGVYPAGTWGVSHGTWGVTPGDWSNAARAIPCLRAAGGDWSKEDFNTNYMVNCRPRDSLSEGRGW